MHNILIEKIKNALKTYEPIETIKEIVSEYEELDRLAKWRISILEKSKILKKDQTKIDEVEERLRDAGYYLQIDINNHVKNYFYNLNKNT